MLDEGRLVDKGTHEELDGPLPAVPAAARRARRGRGGRRRRASSPTTPAATATAGPRAAAGAACEPEAGATGHRRARRRAAAAPDTGGSWPGYRPHPELLAQVDALPPATDAPGVDSGRARAADPRFTLRRLLRPFAVAFMVGLVLDALDALASLAMPALVRGGIDHGVEAQAIGVVLAVSAAALLIVLADWVISAVQTVVVGRNGERLLYTLRVKIFAHLQRLGLDFYERELAGRIMTRMTTDVDALSSFLQTGLISFVNSLLTFAGVLIALLVINLTLGLTVLAILPFAVAATVVFRRGSSRAYADAREKVSVVNADLQENVAGLRVSQAFRREERNAPRFAGRSDDYRRSRLAPSATSRCTSRSSSRCPPSPRRWSCWWRRARCAAAR